MNKRPTAKRIAAVVAAIHISITEAKKRIPDELKGHSFFSPYDIWFYNARSDFKVCPDCRRMELGYTYMGNHLRSNFPYLTITNEDRIEALIHPHCRCFLSRYNFGG